RSRPNCRRYRGDHAMALKLFDAPLLAGGPFASCDSDVLFLRPFRGLDRRGTGEHFACMKDLATAYSMTFAVRHWGRHRLRLPEAVNAGVLYVGPGVYDLDFVEWLLGVEGFRHYDWVVEQTSWAALGGRVGARHFDPRQVAFPPRRGASFSEGWVALHYLSMRGRPRLQEPGYLAELGRRAAPLRGEVATLRTRPAASFGPARDLCGRIA